MSVDGGGFGIERRRGRRGEGGGAREEKRGVRM